MALRSSPKYPALLLSSMSFLAGPRKQLTCDPWKPEDHICKAHIPPFIMSFQKIFIFSFSFFFWGGGLHTHGMLKFPGQGLNSHHSSNPSCSSDNAGSLTHWATTRLWKIHFKLGFLVRVDTILSLYLFQLKVHIFKNQACLQFLSYS